MVADAVAGEPECRGDLGVAVGVEVPQDLGLARAEARRRRQLRRAAVAQRRQQRGNGAPGGLSAPSQSETRAVVNHHCTKFSIPLLRVINKFAVLERDRLKLGDLGRQLYNFEVPSNLSE